MTEQDYITLTHSLASSLLAKDECDINLPELVGRLVPGHEANAGVRRALPRTLHKRFDSAMEKAARAEEKQARAEEQRARVSAVLGCYPSSPSELVTAYAETHQLEVSGDGSVVQHWPTCESVNLHELYLAVRLINGDHRLRMADGHLDAAVSLWHKAEKKSAIRRQRDRLAYDPSYTAALSDLRRIVEATCDTRITPADMVVALFAKHIWQVKRKLHDLPITHHLMLVVGGKQEVGKSTWVRQFLSPLGDLVRQGDFSELTDTRNIELFDAATIFFDEMASASKSDINKIKELVTADSVSRRPMRTNQSIHVKQRATFIGTTNLPLGSILRDETGMRRFVQVMMIRSAHDLINDMDWTALWRAIDPVAADPMLPYKHALMEHQGELRDRIPAEMWLTQYDAAHDSGEYRDGWIPAATLYSSFRSWEDSHFPRNQTGLSVWGRQMTALISDAGVQHKQRAAGSFYRFPVAIWFNQFTAEGEKWLTASALYADFATYAATDLRGIEVTCGQWQQQMAALVQHGSVVFKDEDTEEPCYRFPAAKSAERKTWREASATHDAYPARHPARAAPGLGRAQA